MDTKLAFLLIPVLGACSSTGTSRVSSKVSAAEYHYWSCEKLAEEQMRLSIVIKAVSPETQSSNNFARSKVVQADRQREYEAVTKTMHSKKCSMPRQIVARVS
jgi:hypothetical protein